MLIGAVQSGLSVLPLQYPPVRRDDNVTDDYFGTVVHDPYRWLENTDSNATLACKHPSLSSKVLQPEVSHCEPL